MHPTLPLVPSSDLISLPKAEVHIHMEGCIEVDDIVRLAAEAGEPLPRPRQRLLEFSSGLGGFLAFLDWFCGLVRTREQLFDLAYAFSRRMAGSGARYADVMISPIHWTAWRQDLPALIEALHQGFLAAEQDGLTPVGLCVSLSRNQTVSSAAEVVEIITARPHPRVVALSIDGNEATAGRTSGRFAETFATAAKAGLRRTVHAGESSGPEGVRDAVELLGADRIDHGVRAIEDSELMEMLAERRIPLGIFPTSNLTLGLYARLEDHPIDRLRRAGVPVSVNTDDPALLGVSLQDEYANCAGAFGWDKETLRGVARTSLEASFADSSVKRRLISELATW